MTFNPSQDGCFTVCVDETTDRLASACEAVFPGKPLGWAPHQSVSECCRSGEVVNDVEGRNEGTLSFSWLADRTLRFVVMATTSR